MTTKRIRVGAWLLGLFFPILSFIHALFHPWDKNNKIYFVLFFTFVGLAFFYSGDSADIIKYIREYEYAFTMKGIGFLEFFRQRPDKQQIDYYSAFMIWAVSRFTNNPKIFLGSLAMVFALFFSASVNYVINHIKNYRFAVLLLVVLIVTPRVILLTHRWWTALQIFLFGLLPVLFEKKYIKLLWCFASAFLVHFSFLYPLILIIIALLLPKKVLWPYLLLYVVVSFMDSFDFGFLSPIIEAYLPDLTADRTMSYINYEHLEHNFFSQSAKIVMNIANLIIVVVIYYTNKDNLNSNDRIRQLYTTSLLIGSFASLAALTEWGWRFLDLSNMLFAVFYLSYLSEDCNYNKSISLFKTLSPLFVYFILFQIRGFLTIIGPFQLMAGNYVTTWFLRDNQSVFDLIKQLF